MSAMTLAIKNRALTPGTSGWTAADLDDPEIDRQWEKGRYEILNGVLKTMPPPAINHGAATIELLIMAREHARSGGGKVVISAEVDLIIGEDDVLRVDGMLLSREEIAEQTRVLVRLNRLGNPSERCRVAPLLIIESVSRGHERHDRVTKRRLYAGFGVPNYWVVSHFARTIECLTLDAAAGDYRVDAEGAGDAVLTVTGLGGRLDLPLSRVWEAMYEPGEPDPQANGS